MGSAAKATDSTELTRIMADRIVGVITHAEALRRLRQAFPESPLTVRVAALEMLMRRGADPEAHIPR
jgi:hypothetical protein